MKHAITSIGNAVLLPHACHSGGRRNVPWEPVSSCAAIPCILVAGALVNQLTPDNQLT